MPLVNLGTKGKFHNITWSALLCFLQDGISCIASSYVLLFWHSPFLEIATFTTFLYFFVWCVCKCFFKYVSSSGSVEASDAYSALLQRSWIICILLFCFDGRQQLSLLGFSRMATVATLLCDRSHTVCIQICTWCFRRFCQQSEETNFFYILIPDPLLLASVGL